MIKKKTLTALLLILPAALAAGWNDNAALFEDLRAKLDFSDPKILKTIPAFEDKLLRLTEEARPQLAGQDDVAAGNAAMTFVYAALYLTNTNNGASLGKISYAQLTAARRFSSEASISAELLARQKKIVELLEAAQPHLASDRRVPGWLAGSMKSLERYATGSVSDQSISSELKAAADYPNFNLFTAILGTHDLTLSQENDDKLLKLVKEMAGPDNPCRAKDPNRPADPVCGTLPKAPFNLPAATTLLGDVLAKHAEKYLLGNDPSRMGEGYKLGYTALGVYRSSLEGKHLATTAQWVNANLIKERIQKTEALVKRKRGFGDYWQSWHGQKLYQCASCHAGSLK